MAEQSQWGRWAERNADNAARHSGEYNQTDAIGEGLAAVANALLDVAAAIPERTEAQQ